MVEMTQSNTALYQLKNKHKGTFNYSYITTMNRCYNRSTGDVTELLQCTH